MILGLEIPQILGVTLPISILLATFLTFQKLSSQSEILAIRAAGVSFTRLMKPVAILGLLGACACFLLTEVVVPMSSPFAKKIYTYALYKNPLPKKAKKSFSYMERDAHSNLKRIFYVRSFKDELLKGIVILDFSRKQLAQIYTAKEGSWEPERGGWSLRNGTSTFLKDSNEKKGTSAMHLISNYDETFIPSSANPNEILQKISSLKEMNFVQLHNFIKLHEQAGSRIDSGKLNGAKTKFHTKFSYPFSCIFLAIAGACLGILGRRRAINWGYIIIGLVVFIFYMSQTVFDSFGDSGRIMPMISVWIPNVILGGLAGMAFMYRANKST